MKARINDTNEVVTILDFLKVHTEPDYPSVYIVDVVCADQAGKICTIGSDALTVMTAKHPQDTNKKCATCGQVITKKSPLWETLCERCGETFATPFGF